MANMQMGTFNSGLSLNQEEHYGEWDLTHYPICVSIERVPKWPHHSFYSLHSNFLTNLAHQESSEQHYNSLSLLHQTTLRLGSTFLPDVNTTTASQSFSTQAQATGLSSSLLDIMGIFLFASSSKHVLKGGDPRDQNQRRILQKTQLKYLKVFRLRQVKAKARKETAPLFMLILLSRPSPQK